MRDWSCSCLMLQVCSEAWRTDALCGLLLSSLLLLREAGLGCCLASEHLLGALLLRVKVPLLLDDTHLILDRQAVRQAPEEQRRRQDPCRPAAPEQCHAAVR